MSVKNKQVYLIAAATVAALTVLALLSTFVAFPTPEHVDTARSMHADKFDQDLHASLSSSAAAKYSESVYNTAGFIQFTAFMIATFLIYNKLRSKRLVKNPGGITFAIIIAASVISYILNDIFVSIYILPTGMWDAGIGVYLIINTANALLTAVFALIVILIAEKRYEKKHSFAVE